MSRFLAFRLRLLAKACGMGDADAMLELSKYLNKNFPKLSAGGNMWLLRSALYGNSAAQECLKCELRRNSAFLNASLIPYQNFVPGKRHNWHYGSYLGGVLNAVGLLEFRPNERYVLAGINQHRFMVVWQESDYDPPDEDGFGAEEYYDMFCLDEFFRRMPGVPELRHVSSRDIRYLSVCREQYDAMLRKAIDAVGKRRIPPLWMDFVADD